MIRIEALNKVYRSKKRKKHHALKDVSLTLPDAGLVFVLGKSGSGKSTLLNLIGGLDQITSGKITVDGNDVSSLSESSYANYRNSHIGFIFQDYHLIDELTVAENIRLSLDLRRMEDQSAISSALERVGLSGYETRFPTELSGGEKQRVAIARAIVKKPRIILADEPTGNLDNKTATQIIEIFKALSADCLVLIVSHNTGDAHAFADRIVELSEGRVIADRSKNPDFPDGLVLRDGRIVYPAGSALTEAEIALINSNKGAEIVTRADKFLATEQKAEQAVARNIENSAPTFKRTMSLSGKFLKNKTFAIAFSSFMVAVIMIIMALSQTIIAFDSGTIISEEMAKSNQQSLILNKVLSEGNPAEGTSYLIKTDQNDPQAFYDAGYKGKIYQVLNLSLPVSSSNQMKGKNTPLFTSKGSLNHSLGTMVVDQEFLNNKFGELKFHAKRNILHPQGLMITDYVADAFIAAKADYKGKDYEFLTKYGLKISTGWPYGTLIINGVIDTGYSQKYGDLLKTIASNPDLDSSDLYSNDQYQVFLSDVYDKLGYSYTTNPDFTEQFFASECWMYPSYFNLVMNGIHEFPMQTYYIRKFSNTGSKMLPKITTWTYTDLPPEIPEGAKYMRVYTCTSYQSQLTNNLYGVKQDYTLLEFSNGETVGPDTMKYLQRKTLGVTGNAINSTSNNNFVSDYIKIPEGATISKFVTAVLSNGVFCAFYDEDKNFISNKISQVCESIEENTIILPINLYGQLFPEKISEGGEKWSENFVPHKARLSHFHFWDNNKTNPLIDREVTVKIDTGNSIILSDDLFSLFYKDAFFHYALYFDGTDGISTVLDTAESLNYQPQSFALEAIHTMTKAVDVFVPIFELIAIFLCIGVVFILISFSSKMIKDKMHEIGILKALGTKNSTITVIFGLQIALIAVFTCLLASIGYFLFIDLANDVLVESLTRLAPNMIMIDLDFLRFKPIIALINGVLVLILSCISLIVPILKIRRIEPVKIIKSKE